MTRRLGWFGVLCWAAGVLLLLAVLVPLIGLLARTGAGGIADALRQGDVRRSLVLTLTAALTATAIVLVVGVPFSYLLARRRFAGRAIVESALDLPVVVPHTAAGIALLTVYGRDGIIGRALAPLGITFTESFAGIVLAMVFVSLPFLVSASRQSFAQVDERYEGVARTLGASPFGAFARITLPLAWRGVMAGALMMWARGISEFGAVVILAYNPKVIPVLVYERFEGFGLDAALAPAALIVLVALAAFVALRLLLTAGRWRRADRRRSWTGAAGQAGPGLGASGPAATPVGVGPADRSGADDAP
jgi:molybdate/tungstate transport system permease protein